MSRHSKKRHKLRSLYNWHRYLGITISLFVIYLAFTGIVLNHSNDMALDKNHVQSSVVLDWYGIQQPEHLDGFQVGQHWITYWSGQIFFNDKLITQTKYPLKGAIETPLFIMMSTTEEIWLLTIDGEVIEKLTTPAEKLGDIKQLGIVADLIVIETTRGYYQADKDMISWQTIKQPQAEWALASRVPAALKTQLLSYDHSITWERLLLDLHSGRILTKSGVFVIDLVGGVMIFLAISGLSIWYIRNRKLKQHKKHS